MSNPGQSNKDEREGRRLDAQLLSDLWIFRAVARAGSMAAAATQLSVTAGAVSQRVLRLEARLQTKLFQRDKGRIALTEAGSSVLEAMNGAALALNGALTKLEGPQNAGLVVSCAPSLAMEWLMPNLQEFYRECPGIELQVRSETIQPSAAWMAGERIDVLISYMHVRPNDLVELASLQELTLPVCSRAYRGRLQALPPEQRTVVAMHDDDPWREGEAPRAEWQEWLAGAGADPGFKLSGDQHFNQAYLAYQAAMYGQGVAMGRAVSVNGLLKSGKLVPLVDRSPVSSAHYRIFARTEQAPDSACARFAAWLAGGLARTQKETLTLVTPGP